MHMPGSQQRGTRIGQQLAAAMKTGCAVEVRRRRAPAAVLWPPASQ